MNLAELERILSTACRFAACKPWESETMSLNPDEAAVMFASKADTVRDLHLILRDLKSRMNGINRELNQLLRILDTEEKICNQLSDALREATREHATA